MFAPLPSPAEMSGWDRAAIDLGLPELLLMENASREALHVLSAETGHMPCLLYTSELTAALETLGVSFTFEGKPGFPPFVLKTCGLDGGEVGIGMDESSPVSYTHLDVYKRQHRPCASSACSAIRRLPAFRRWWVPSRNISLSIGVSMSSGPTS